MIRRHLLAIGLFLFAVPCFAQTDTLPAFVRDSLDNYINRALKEWQIPGVSVAIIKNNKVAWLKGYGVREMNGTDPVDENTLFMIGSNTKAFTATAAAMIAQDSANHFSLDDHVKKWLPAFKLYDPWVAKEATVRDLLCHRLGFETFQGDFMYFDSDLSAEQVLDKMGKLKPNYSFRSKWGYTNSAFLAAGRVIANVSGDSWADYLQKNIFKPAGMSRTLALSTSIDTATNRATAHTVVMGDLRKIPYGHLDNLAPAGSISSSAADMSKWVMLQLNDGRINGHPVVPAAAIRATRVPQSILGDGGHMFNKAHFSLYGLGWFLEEYAGRKIVQHTGGVNGFVTSVCLVPEEKLGIVVLTNTDANLFYEALRNEIEDAYLGLPYRNYSKIYRSYQWADDEEKARQYKLIRDTIALKPMPALPLTSYTGEYQHAVYGKMTMKKEGDKLIMRFEHHTGMYGTLEAMGGNVFFCTYSDPLYGMKKLSFSVVNGKVKSLTVRVADFVEFTTYDFIKIK